MQHLVFGAGLIGGYLGAAIAANGQKVCLIGRASVLDKWQQGIRLTDYQGNQSGPVTPELLSKERLNEAPKGDILWLTVKCIAIEQAIRDMAPLIKADTRIFCCQNGLGAESLVQQAYPDNPVHRAVVGFNVTEETDATLHCGSEGCLTLERLHADDPVPTLVNTLSSPLLRMEYSSAMTELQWAKLQLNLGNAVNALADIPVKSMLRQRAYRKVLALLMDELLGVAKAKGLRLPKLTALPAAWIPWVLRLPDWLFERLANTMLAIDPKVRTSMWWDLHLKRKTEIAFLNGAVVEEALSLGLGCAANQVIHQLIREVEQGIRQPGMQAGELLRRVTTGPL
ncbi:2-dehydropantoate 2-reductase [Lacimicrobium alkaliphilum]|uniref:2-dehydropantoate 2-reductase n=1 Tax=Lacimicrobium alkaliphilum TaxID=1526571 RepID=A0ABQ1R421_9ALTE|nr:2-dehydropantoate 2-reductase [Lacimicrobium alkaliphilum]GGD54262.1 2-dehydropantoate 2-reductase [Lacimicrobium alkaliphilum]